MLKTKKLSKEKRKIWETPRYRRMVDLGWDILKYKFAYYCQDRVHPDFLHLLQIPDHVYDALENEYRELCKEFGNDPVAADMVGFDENRGSCELVARTWGHGYKDYEIIIGE